LIEFGDPIDDLGHVVAEAGGNFLLGRRRILDHVVQDRRNQRVGVEVKFGQDLGRGHRMSDVGLAA
jgi:hypothetical protein